MILSAACRHSETCGLDLVALLPVEGEALVSGDVERASALLGINFPPGWPHEREPRDGLSWQLRAVLGGRKASALADPGDCRAFLQHRDRFDQPEGPPDGEGDVEIGRGLNVPFRWQGYALESAAAVVTWALQQSGVASISATLPDDDGPSQHLAARLGLLRTSETRRGLTVWRAATASS